MKSWKYLLLVMLPVLLTACSESDSGARLDITLQPSQIAVHAPSSPAAETPKPTPEPVRLTREGVVAEETTPDAALPTTETVPTESTDAPAQPTPTSNTEELQALVENPNLLAVMEMETSCFLENDFIPFRLKVVSLETQPIYFYRSGKWLMSINNSPLGPQLASRIPTLREEFIEIPPNESYTQEEEDLGLWVLSLGPQSGIAFTPTGVGLPVGEYWITFMYTNDQDGLTEQPDGTYLIEKAAWQGTAVAPEVRFKVVDDLSKC